MVTDFSVRRKNVLDTYGVKYEDFFTVEDYLKQAKLNFNVLKVPLYAKVFTEEPQIIDGSNVMVPVGLLKSKPNTRWKNMPASYALVRDDDGEMFTTNGKAVTSTYSVFQNREMFEFLNQICDIGNVKYDTAGSFNSGRRVFVTIDLKDNIEIFPNDTIERRLLISSRHDGKGSINIKFINTRVVCQNTLELALRENTPHSWSIRHTTNKDDKLDTVKDIIGSLKIQKQEVIEKLKYYKQVELSEKQQLALLALSYFPTKTYVQLKQKNFVLIDSMFESTKDRNQLKEFNQLRATLKLGVGQNMHQNTLLHVYNGITCYIQNVKEYANGEEHFDNVFNDNTLTTFESKLVENLLEVSNL